MHFLLSIIDKLKECQVRRCNTLVPICMQILMSYCMTDWNGCKASSYRWPVHPTPFSKHFRGMDRLSLMLSYKRHSMEILITNSKESLYLFDSGTRIRYRPLVVPIGHRSVAWNHLCLSMQVAPNNVKQSAQVPLRIHGQSWKPMDVQVR